MLRAMVIRQLGGRSCDASTFLHGRECHIHYALSYREARDELEAADFDFDLVLSPIRIGNRSGLHLADLLEGSSVSLFYFYAVEQGTWWMPGVRHGEKCFGTAALRSEEFGTVLGEILESARVRRQLGRVGLPFKNRQATG